MILGSHRIEKVTGSDGSPLIGVLYARAHTRTRDNVYNRQPVTTRHVSRISKAAPGGIRQNPREIWVAAPAVLSPTICDDDDNNPKSPPITHPFRWGQNRRQ